MRVQASVAAQCDAVVAASLLDHEARPLEPAAHRDPALVGGGRVVGGLEDQRGRDRVVADLYGLQRLHRPGGARGVVPGVVPGHEGRLAVCLPGVVAPGAPAPRPAGVAALHGRVDGVSVLAGLVDGGEVVVRRGERLLVLVVHVRRERLGQTRPVAVVVAAGQERVLQFARPDPARRGVLLHRVAHPVPGGLDPGRVLAEPVGRVVLRHPRGEGLVAGVERVVLGEVVLVPDAIRVDDRVQHQAADALGEQLGVDRAQVGAVGVAEVVDLPGAEGPADDVEVLRGADGVHVRQQIAVLLAARGGEGRRAVACRPLRRVGVRHGVGAYGGEVLRQAVQRGGALPDPARVEPDHVVLRGQLRGQRGRHEARHGESAAAGAAGVDQQGALRGLRRVRDAGEGEGDRHA